MDPTIIAIKRLNVVNPSVVALTYQLFACTNYFPNVAHIMLA
jgi:hypothetical protein